MSKNVSKIVSGNAEQVIEKVSKSIIALAVECITKSGYFTIALSGGNTPKLLYQYLVSENLFKVIDNSKLFIYFGDERYVPHDDNRSNYGLAKKYLLDYLDIPEDNIFPVNTTFKNADDSAKNYQKIIIDNVDKNTSSIPELDLIILGMGEDGHTASLFPDSDLASSTDTIVGSCYHDESNTNRISFTFPLINAAKNVYIIAMGAGKFEILNNIRDLEEDKTIKYPVQQVNPQGELIWFIDAAADQGNKHD